MIVLHGIRQDRVMDWFDEKRAEDAADPLCTVVLVSYGKCVYWLGGEGGMKVILERGDAMLIPAGTPYYAKSVPSVFHEKVTATFSFAPGIHAGDLPGMLRQLHWVKLKPAMFEWAAERFQAVAEEWAERLAFAELRGAAVLTELLVLWSRQWSQGPVPSSADYCAQRMKDYILSHYREKITKETLGDYIERSPNYAAHLFRRATGQTISEYVHATRIKKAIYLLEESVLTVAEVSDMLGYPDVSYFHRLFKKATGRIPSDFRGDRRR